MDIPISGAGETMNSERAVPAPRKKGRLERLVGSPLLLVALVLATSILTFKWYSLQAVLRAPVLPGWSWAAHPNTLLIYYPHTDCGCGPGLSAALGQADAKHFDVAVITDVQGKKLAAVAQEANTFHAHLLASAKPEALRRWLRNGNALMLHVRNGRVVGQAAGTVIPESFFKD